MDKDSIGERKETDKYNVLPACCSCHTEHTRRNRNNHSITEMIEASELNFIQRCLSLYPEEYEKSSPHEHVSLSGGKKETDKYNVLPACRSCHTEHTRRNRNNHSITEMIEAFELNFIQGCLSLDPEEYEKSSPHEHVSLSERNLESEVALLAEDTPKCFEDSNFMCAEDFKAMLEIEEEEFKKENKFQCAAISPFAQRRMPSPFKKEEKIFLMQVSESRRGFITSDPTLNGLGYNSRKYVTGNKTSYMIAIHNMGLQTIYAEAQLYLYSDVKKIAKDLRFKPSVLVLEEKAVKKIHISFTCETESFDKLNLPAYGFVTLTYHNKSGKDQLWEKNTLSLPQSSAKSEYETVRNNRSNSITHIKEEWWDIEPQEVQLSNSVQKARIALINNSGRNIRFKLQWDCSFISVSPIHGILSTNGDLGLRLNLPYRIKYGETFITVTCNNTSKVVRIIVEK